MSGALTPTWARSRRLRLRLKWEPRDLWIGVYWTRKQLPSFRAAHLTTVYVCVLPTLPFVLQVRTGTPR